MRRVTVALAFLLVAGLTEKASADVGWDSIQFRCTFAMSLSEAVAAADVTMSQWRDIQTTDTAKDLLNRALQAASAYCQSGGHEVRDPYNHVLPVRWWDVRIFTEKRRELIHATISPSGQQKAENSSLQPSAALVAGVNKLAAVEAEEQRIRRREAEQREALAKAQEEERRQRAEREAHEAAERERLKQAALHRCGAEPVLQSGPWRSYISSAYKYAVQDLAQNLKRSTFLCISSIEYLGDAPNPFGGNAARLKIVGADIRTFETIARVADVAY